MSIKWIKAYKGPFSKRDAMELVDGFKRKIDTLVVARIRRRGGVKSKKELYDVYIKTEV